MLAVIVNYNAGELLQRCVRSVLEQDLPVAVVVIDNASTDGSADRLASRFGADPRFALIRGGDNPGFATAVNRAVAQSRECFEEAGGEFLLILNPDCELQTGSLSALVAALQGRPQAAVAGPLVVDGQGRPQRANLRRFPDPWRSFLTFSGLWRLGRRWPAWQGVEWPGALPDHDTVAEAVSGACMLLRRDAFLAVGGMDGEYRLHCEDLDLMYRLRQMGGECLYVPTARVAHAQGVSSSSRPLWVHWHKHRGMQRFFRKFQAADHSWPLRSLVHAGIWLRWLATLPLAWLRH